MKKKVYGTFRYYYTNNGVRYSPSYRLNLMYEDYIQAGLTKILDNEIPEERYTAEIAPGIKKKTRFIIGEYEDTVIDPVLFAENIAKVGAEFAIWMFNNATEAIQWLKANTDLKVLNEQLDANGNPIYAEFEIYPAGTDPVTGEQTPAKILVID